MPKCYKLDEYVVWTGDNLEAIKPTIQFWFGGDTVFTVDGNGALHVLGDGWPPKVIPVNGVFIPTNGAWFPDETEFQKYYGVVP